MLLSVTQAMAQEGLNSASGPMPIGAAGHTHIMIMPDGKVGIGTLNPVTKLDVNGYIKVVRDRSLNTCTQQIMGSLRINDTTNPPTFEGCNGTSWVPLFGGINCPSSTSTFAHQGKTVNVSLPAAGDKTIIRGPQYYDTSNQCGEKLVWSHLYQCKGGTWELQGTHVVDTIWDQSACGGYR